MLKELSYRFGVKDERRRGPRVVARNLVRHRLGKPSDENPILNLVDISRGGMKICSAGRLDPGQILDLVINLASGVRQMSVVGEVKWVSDTRYKNFCQAGIHFLRVTKEDRSHIKDYVEQQLAARHNGFSFLLAIFTFLPISPLLG